jgi:hypothetical protein
MLEDILEIRKVNGIDVYFRKEDKQVKNKAVELEKIIKYLTNAKLSAKRKKLKVNINISISCLMIILYQVR